MSVSQMSRSQRIALFCAAAAGSIGLGVAAAYVHPAPVHWGKGAQASPVLVSVASTTATVPSALASTPPTTVAAASAPASTTDKGDHGEKAHPPHGPKKHGGDDQGEDG